MTDNRKTKTHDSWACLRVAVNGDILADPLEKETLATEIAMLAARDSAHADHHHHPQSRLAAMTSDGLIV
ncbi:MAG: hypothetical protein WCF85_21725 [Rhodospirillaceae bacterium]